MTARVLPRLKLKSGFVRDMLHGHAVLGLSFAALIYVVCLSGTIVVFYFELRSWETPEVPVVQTVSPELVSSALEEAVTKGEDVEGLHIHLRFPREAYPRLTVEVEGGNGERRFWVARPEGGLVPSVEAPFTDFMSGLHVYLHQPGIAGSSIIGLSGILTIAALISGVLSHPRMFKDAFKLRWGGARRVQEADLHLRLGVWALPFHFIVSLTGALLGLAGLFVGVIAFAALDGDMEKLGPLFSPGQVVREGTAPAPLPDTARIFAAAAEAAPSSHITDIELDRPGTAGQTVAVTAVDPRALSYGDVYVFSGDGTLLQRSEMRALSAGQKMLHYISQLHFGWFGGWPVKLAYVLLGLALTVITVNGVSIWLAKKRAKGLPELLWERVWPCFVWSQPLGFAVCASLSLAGFGGDFFVPLWLGVTAAALLAGALWQSGKVGAWVRVLAGLALMGVVCFHALRYPAWQDGEAVLLINAVSIITALCIIIPPAYRGFLLRRPA